MLLLRSNRVFKDIIELDPTTGNHRELSDAGVIDAKLKINGFFDRLNGTLVALYALSGQLYLKIGEKVVNINQDVTVVVAGDACNRQLKVSDKSGELVSVAYTTSDLSNFKNDPTPFVENEDFDFGLFVSNIATSAERRSVALEGW